MNISTVAAVADGIDLASRGEVRPLVVDLTQVDVLASAGVPVLFTARDRHAGHAIAMTILTIPGGVPARSSTSSASSTARATRTASRYRPPRAWEHW